MQDPIVKSMNRFNKITASLQLFLYNAFPMTFVISQGILHFQLGRGEPMLHTRLRPHCKVFLEKIAKMYELHVFTFGSRLYAHTIAGKQITWHERYNIPSEDTVLLSTECSCCAFTRYAKSFPCCLALGYSFWILEGRIDP